MTRLWIARLLLAAAMPVYAQSARREPGAAAERGAAAQHELRAHIEESADYTAPASSPNAPSQADA